MKVSAVALAIAVACFANPVAAQQLSPVPVVGHNGSVLTVTSEGKSLQRPDLAIFNAGVTTQGKNAGEALAANSTAMERVIAELRRAGIAERDIQTSNLTVEPVYSDPNREAEMAARYGRQPYPPPEASIPKIVAYRASNSVSVRQRVLKNFGRVIDTLVAAGAKQVSGPSFTIDNPEPALDEARVAAVQQARERANLYARAAGLRVVRILSISEGGGYFGPPPVMFARGSVGGAPPPAAPPPPPAPVQPGELQMTANITALFELAAS